MSGSISRTPARTEAVVVPVVAVDISVSLSSKVFRVQKPPHGRDPIRWDTGPPCVFADRLFVGRKIDAIDLASVT
jgi:hypothetical protein